MVVTGIAIDDVQLCHLVEMMLGGIGGVDARHTRVEAAAEDGRETSLLKLLLVGPLPRIFEVRLVFRLIVGRVHIVAATSQTGLHDGEILVRQGEVEHQLRLVLIEQRLQLLHVVGIHLVGSDFGQFQSLAVRSPLFLDSLNNGVAFFLASAGNNKFVEHVSVLCNLMGGHGSHATSANH